jgi:hypothetical protein
VRPAPVKSIARPCGNWTDASDRFVLWRPPAWRRAATGWHAQGLLVTLRSGKRSRSQSRRPVDDDPEVSAMSDRFKSFQEFWPY